jgi:RNA polymerase sigma-70 factor, ECF subfamily
MDSLLLEKERTLARTELLDLTQDELTVSPLPPLVEEETEQPPLELASLDDEPALVAQARQDPASFGILYERYVERVYAYIYHRVGNMQDTEDLTARTFYRALDKLETYEDRGLPFSAWLFRIAHNLVANWHRDRGRRRFLSLDRLWLHSKAGDTPEEYLEEAEAHAALWTAINRLPKERRDLLLYKFSSRLSNLEIGEVMNKSEGAIKSLYFRTLSALRKDLEAMGWGDRSPQPLPDGSEERDA